jgi:hypothetical protein
MIVEESRLQALTSLYSTTKDMFLQTNSHRLWCLALLVAALILLSVLFFRLDGPVKSMVALAATVVSFTLLLSELYLSRRLSLTRAVLVNIERELSQHIAKFVGQDRASEESQDRAGGLWPLTLMTGGVQGSSLVSTDSRNWIVFIHGLVAYAVTIPWGSGSSVPEISILYPLPWSLVSSSGWLPSPFS